MGPAFKGFLTFCLRMYSRRQVKKLVYPLKVSVPQDSTIFLLRLGVNALVVGGNYLKSH